MHHIQISTELTEGVMPSMKMLCINFHIYFIINE
jgi:hypothetical protein